MTYTLRSFEDEIKLKKKVHFEMAYLENVSWLFIKLNIEGSHTRPVKKQT